MDDVPGGRLRSISRRISSYAADLLPVSRFDVRLCVSRFWFGCAGEDLGGLGVSNRNALWPPSLNKPFSGTTILKLVRTTGSGTSNATTAFLKTRGCNLRRMTPGETL